VLLIVTTFWEDLIVLMDEGELLSPWPIFTLAPALNLKSGKSELKCGHQEAFGRSLIERINYFQAEDILVITS
jgi:hypothetical protein